jgi:hypothetical protein
MSRLRLVSLVVLLAGSLAAQVLSTSSLSGTVSDPSGAVIPNAKITVRNQATGTVYNAETAGNGVFVVPGLPTGDYTVIVEAQGFRQAQVQNVKVTVGVPTNIKIGVEVGATTETVVVEGTGAILQTQSSTVSATLEGRQILDLPLVSRDALDLVLSLPGVNTPGRPRTSTINGLPKAAINITLDGINVQDNLGKSGDGYFTYIRPRLDAIQEVTVSTATAGAESTAEGAVQVKFVTRGGTNEYRGSLYEYHRNPVLNANYWFANRDLPADPATGKAPRQKVILNQYGFRVGGPISIPGLFSGRNRAFFFVNYEEFRLPEQATRNRTIFHPDTQAGTFQYNSSTGVRRVNLLSLAQANGQVSTIDPIVGKLLADIRATTVKGGVTQLTDPNLQRFTFINKGGQVRRFPTMRFDFNLTPKHSLELTYNYQDFAGLVDFLNNTDPAFPGFPNQGSQGSDRFSGAISLRSTLTPRIVNEFRAGLQGGTVLFFAEVNSGQFTGALANQGGFSLNINAAGITSATVSTSPSRRNTPVKQFTDNLNMSLGAHTLSLGGSFTQVNAWSYAQAAVPTTTMGVDTSDPAAAMFTTANFPGASNTDLTNARNIYAVLTGRFTAINATAQLAEDGSKYVYLGPNQQRFREREHGVYFQDSWRVRPNVTLNLGLRWEVQYPFAALNNKYAKTSFAEIYGVSGLGNLFKPGTLTGKETQFVPLPPGERSHNPDYSNFSPSVGVAWSPKADSGILRALFGGSGRGVIRAGYSIAYNREGISAFSARMAGNPGGFINANKSVGLGNIGTLPVLLRETSRLGPPAFSTTPSFPLTGTITDAANVIDPNLKMPYVHTWSVGVQREIGKDMVLELRYLGNRAQRSWGAFTLNEQNVLTNGFLNEFRLAQANLQANIAAGRGNTFRYFGAGTGTSPLPIILAYFSGIPAAQAGESARYTSTNFSNTTFVNTLALQNPQPFTFVGNIAGAGASATLRNNALTAGLPPNFFVVNPGKLGGANLLTNFGGSNYHAATIELRRRFSHGLLANVNYTFGKALQDILLSWHRPTPERVISPLNITHAFKTNWIFELPVGRGRRFAGNSGGVLDHLIGGWAIDGTARIQSGTPFNFGNVRLVGMTRHDLQKAVGMRFNDGAKIAYYLPQDIVDNTIRAFNVSATSASGYGAQGAPTGRYIAPANSPGCIEVIGNQCGFTRVLLTGPMFTKFDISLIKKVRVTERVNVELRAEFLNAFNNINFIVGNPANDTNNITNFSNAAFGQVTEAYRDTSTTNDPGGRLVQLVLRINF